MPKNIQHTLFFPYPPEIVWEYLTTAELIAQWLMPNDFKPIVGYNFQFKVNPMPALQFDGNVYCKVVEIVPHKKLSYSWKCGPGNGEMTVDSLVEWTLVRKDNGTELHIDHSGFNELKNLDIYAAMDHGWLANMKKIGERLKAA